jgi:glycosyltransferase involved in cell wall biosynthesis
MNMSPLPALSPKETGAIPDDRQSAREPVKLVIQIPCYNEEAALPATLADLPREIAGVDVVEWLVVNDGSTDRTVEVALAAGVDHVVSFPVHMGLAHAFMAGLKHALDLGADIIVNTDADNQYRAEDIPALIAPILERRAQFVIGDRPIATISHFSQTKRRLQRLGSQVVGIVSGTSIRDAPSGFRALSREAALQMNVFDSYTYTLETIIQAGLSGIRVASVPIAATPETRPSRLVRSIGDYVVRSIGSILHTFFIYKPGLTFFLIGLLPAVLGAALVARWIWLSIEASGGSHVPSLVAAAILLIMAGLLWLASLFGALLSINRRLLQDIQYMLRANEARAAPEKPVVHSDDS